jgi:transcriptional regulator with XRE-family HTH domain
MDIGTNIRKYREIRGLTLPDLAQKAGVSKAFVWEIENGNSKRPGAETLFKIAEALDVTIAHLMGKEPAASGQPLIEPEINQGLWDFINERKRQGTPLDPEEVKSLSFVQLRGGRPRTKEQWALIYGMLNEMTVSP